MNCINVMDLKIYINFVHDEELSESLEHVEHLESLLENKDLGHRKLRKYY